MRTVALQWAIFALSLASCWSAQSFKTQPTFTPPVFTVNKLTQHVAPGFIFLTPSSSQQAGAAVIMRDNGELIWSSTPGNLTNLAVQKLKGKDVLVYWQGQTVGAWGYGSIYILDTSYKPLYTICPDLHLNIPSTATPTACQADFHDAYLTDHGTLLVTAYNVTQADLSAVPKSNGKTWVLDCLFYEIELATQKIIFSWSALKTGIPIETSKFSILGAGTQEDPYDWFHINSVQKVGDEYLIVARNLWSVFMIDAKGGLDWEFQGETGASFDLLENEDLAMAQFSWPHHARASNITAESIVLSLFDNANNGYEAHTKLSVGLVFVLNLRTKQATLNDRFDDPKQPLYVDTRGSVQILPNGNTLLGYGDQPFIKEFDGTGEPGDVAMTIGFGGKNDDAISYRAFKYEWEAIPAADPVLVVEKGMAYMSWNGATSVTQWEIWEGTTATKLDSKGAVKKTGFETSIEIGKDARFVRVTARNEGEFLRSSAVMAVG